jgi:hypothetical protein
MPFATPFAIIGEMLANVTAMPDFASGVLGNTTKLDGGGRVELTVTRVHPVIIITSTTVIKARDCQPNLRLVLDCSSTVISAHSTKLAIPATSTCKLKSFGM